jgi:transcriptional regulator with XRE-family HTH domain
MPSFINSTMRKIWKKMARKGYRDGYVDAHISNTVSSQITKLRTEHNWTQTQLADHAGMKQSRISVLEDPNWENVEIATLKRIASAFDVGLTVRFVPYSYIAEWAAGLSEHRLFVPTYNEEIENAPAAESPAARAFMEGTGSQSQRFGSIQNITDQLPPGAVPKIDTGAPRAGALQY